MRIRWSQIAFRPGAFMPMSHGAGTHDGTVPSLDGTGRIPAAQLGSGTPNGTKVLRDDSTWVDPPSGTPSGTVATLDGTSVAGTETVYSRGDHRHADANRPTDGQKGALAGTSGTPSADNAYVTTQDTRMSDARTALSHTHAAGDVTGTAVVNSDARLSDARAPLSHAASHKSAGSDAVKLDELAAPTDITTLNATTAAHGLLPKLGGGVTDFLRADGAWAPPTASVAISTASVPFTDGDTMRRVTITDAAITASSKIVGTIIRPDTADDSADAGYLYLWNIVKRAAGSFDVLVSCLGWGFDDPTEKPPNETIVFAYTVA